MDLTVVGYLRNLKIIFIVWNSLYALYGVLILFSMFDANQTQQDYVGEINVVYGPLRNLIETATVRLYIGLITITFALFGIFSSVYTKYGTLYIYFGCTASVIVMHLIWLTIEIPHNFFQTKHIESLLYKYQATFMMNKFDQFDDDVINQLALIIRTHRSYKCCGTKSYSEWPTFPIFCCPLETKPNCTDEEIMDRPPCLDEILKTRTSTLFVVSWHTVFLMMGCLFSYLMVQGIKDVKELIPRAISKRQASSELSGSK